LRSAQNGEDLLRDVPQQAGSFDFALCLDIIHDGRYKQTKAQTNKQAVYTLTAGVRRSRQE
jgi:hypothetical protein